MIITLLEATLLELPQNTIHKHSSYPAWCTNASLGWEIASTFSPSPLTLLGLSDHFKLMGLLGKEQPNTATKASPDTCVSKLPGEE